MDLVGPDLFVGTLADATDSHRLEKDEITVVVSLTHENPDFSAQTLDTHSIPLIDGPQNNREQFTKAVEKTVTALNDGKRVLVHCAAGASRSPTVAATALALSQEMDMEDAIQQVADRREAVDPHEALLRQAAHVYTQLSDSSSLN